MKTIIVVYSDYKKNNVAAGSMKKYAFNCAEDVKVGDMFDSPKYDTKMQVVKVLDKKYKYFNRATGDLSDEYTSTEQWEIKTLVIREDQANVVYASIVPEKDTLKL